MSDDLRDYAVEELLAKIGLASSGEAWQPILTAMQKQHPDFRERDKLVSAFWKGVDNAIRPLCEEVLRLRAEKRQAEEDAARRRMDGSRLYHCPKCCASFSVSFDRRSGYYLCRAYSGSIDAAGKSETRPCTYSSKEPPHA